MAHHQLLENHPNGHTSRELALIDARVAVASLCAQARSPEYRAVITEAIHAIESLARPQLTQPRALVELPGDVMWAAAADEVGTHRVPPYGFPVIVLPRAADVVALYRAILRRMGVADASGANAQNLEHPELELGNTR